MPKLPDQAALLDVEIDVASHIHNGEEKARGDTIQVDKPTAQLLAKAGVIKPLPPEASPEQTAVSSSTTE